MERDERGMTPAERALYDKIAKGDYEGEELHQDLLLWARLRGLDRLPIGRRNLGGSGPDG